jgi:hypothetical protein
MISKLGLTAITSSSSREAAREDDVGRELEVFDVLAGARHAIAQDGLEGEEAARLDVARALVEVLAIELDRHAFVGLRRRHHVVDHLDGDQRVVGLLRVHVRVVHAPELGARDVARDAVVVLLGRESDAVYLFDAAPRDVLHVGAPAAADVEHGLLVVQLGEVVEPAALVLLGRFEGLIPRLVDRRRVVHALVEPKAEEVVGEAVRKVDFFFGRGHGASSESGRLRWKWHENPAFASENQGVAGFAPGNAGKERLRARGSRASGFRL